MNHKMSQTTSTAIVREEEHPTMAQPVTLPSKSSTSCGYQHSPVPEKKERRRKQVRLAQRAYRARNEANTAALKQRIARLESTLKQINNAVVAFNKTIEEEHVLASHPSLSDRLRETVRICLDSVMQWDEYQADVGHSKSDNLYQGVQTPINVKSIQRGHPEASHSCVHQTCISAYPRNRFLPFKLNTTTAVEASVFVQHLRVTCLYQGLLMLKNPSIPLEALRRPFRLLLSLVTREAITSFFFTRLQARVNNKQPKDWNEIPFFELGGAGTHYRDVPPSSRDKPETWGSGECHFPVNYSTLSTILPEIQQELDGEWFDACDLTQYLQTEKISLSMTPPTGATTHRTVNAMNFTAALVENSICLGPSPGFKRSDVEIAISSSAWT